MAFFGKAGKMLRSSISQISQETSLSRPSIFQVIRCMSSSKLFIGGLSYSTDDMSLREAFNKYGDVAEARVIVDRDTGRSRGFGFVTYASVEEASAAIQALDQQELHGRRIRVDYANDRARGYGGGGFRGGNFGGGYNGGFGGSYTPAGGNNNADGYGGNYGSGGYGSNYASNNSYDGGNLSYGGNGQNLGSVAGGSDNFFSTGAGAASGSASTGYDGFGDKFGSEKSRSEAGADEGFGGDESLEGNYRDGDDTYDSYADKRS